MHVKTVFAIGPQCEHNYTRSVPTPRNTQNYMVSTHTQKHSCKLVIIHQEAEELVMHAW